MTMMQQMLNKMDEVNRGINTNTQKIATQVIQIGEIQTSTYFIFLASSTLKIWAQSDLVEFLVDLGGGGSPHFCLKIGFCLRGG